MSDVTMEDYARLAEEIGMRQGQGPARSRAMFWDPVAKMSVRTDNLRYHLAEPAQFSRILRVKRIARLMYIAQTDEWMALAFDAAGLRVDATADTPEAAARDCAALALRERT